MRNLFNTSNILGTVVLASILTFGGGTNEIQRDIISMAGLSMPREKR